MKKGFDVKTIEEKFCQEIINGVGGFKNMEKYEVAVFPDRDVAIAEWTLRCLANKKNKYSRKVLDDIIAHRNSITESHE